MFQKTLLFSSQAGLALILANTTPTAFADDDVHYSWRNEFGGIVYSDRPPPKGTDYEVVSSGSGLKRVVDGEKGAVPLTVKPTPGNEFDQIDTRNDQTIVKNEVLCEKAKMNLVALEGADVVNVRDANGEPRALSSEEREIAKQTAKAHINVYCP